MIVVLAMALVGTAACSGGGADSASGSINSGASASSSVSDSSQPDGPPVGAEVDATSFVAKLNAAAKKAGSYRMQQLDDKKDGIQVDMRFGNPPAGTWVVTSSGVTTKVLTFPDRAYATISNQKLPAGKKWLLARWGGKDELSKGMALFIYWTKQAVPVSISATELKAIKLTREDDQQVGATMCGVYAFQETKAQQLAGIATLPAAVRSDLTADVHGDMTGKIFVGPDGLVRRYEISFQENGNLGKLTSDFSNWGKALTITAPKATEVLDAAKLGG